MPVTIEQVTQEALSLSDQERAQLAHRLLKSLGPVENAEETDIAWEAEIARRVERVRQGSAKGRLAEDVFRDIRARY